jgi:hypothetical protein
MSKDKTVKLKCKKKTAGRGEGGLQRELSPRPFHEMGADPTI